MQRNARRFISGLTLIINLSLLVGCSHDKEAWLKDLPVEAQTSLKGKRHQDIRLTRIYETREVDGKIWMRGKGYADVNDRTEKFFWEAKQQPNLEITIEQPDTEEYRQCRLLFDQMSTKKRMVQLKGDGLFSAKGNENEGFVGIFRIDNVAQCTLGPKA